MDSTINVDEPGDAFETLKKIVRAIRDPQALDDHRWVHSLIVHEALDDIPDLQKTNPGQQLIGAIERLFRQLQPATPPRRGKRLDPRWGEFGLLAALYFTPYKNGTSFPATFMDAWRRIDQAILYFVYGKSADQLSQEEVEKYRLVGSDVEYGSASTLSDWHKKGLQRLTELILNREQFLSRNRAESSVILEPASPAKSRNRPVRWKRAFWISSLFILLVGIGLGAYKGWRIYQHGMLVYQDVTELREMRNSSIGLESLDTVIPLLTTLQTDLSSFKQEARLLLWLSPAMGWVPAYGADLVAAPALIDVAEHMVNASVLSAQAAQPILKEFDAEDSKKDVAGLTALLVQAQPQWVPVRNELDLALMARTNLDAEQLSPRLHDLLIEEVDPLLKLADDGLSLATALPGLLGAGSDGPKTYLLLAQNEDELRPTGGFITSVGNLVVHNGQVISMEFEGVDNEQEDWSKPYPSAPWQLQAYMNSRVLILRDSNWFSDFPTSARWAEYLYAYTHDHSVDGVIAFDQQFLVMLLRELGPLEVEGAPYPLTDANVIEYMRQAKNRPEDNPSADWYRKDFISKIAGALLKEITSGEDHDWRSTAYILSQALAERHLLLQFDDPALAELAAARGWDHAIRPGDGDYLLVTDTNVGFNKTSAVVDVSLDYVVDLSDPAAPISTLTVSHKNNATGNPPCIHWNTGQIPGEDVYPINRCYWTYLRVYKQEGVTLLDATPHAIPGDWMLLGQPVPARVDALDEELPGVLGVGTMLVVPGNDVVHTSFQFSLLPDVLITQTDTNQRLYRLHIQKQPGTLAIPVTVRIHIPNSATLQSTSLPGNLDGSLLLVETNLKHDVNLEILFTIP